MHCSPAFRRALDFTLLWEGGTSNDPDDPGRLTRFGIAQAYHPDVDVAALTLDGARAIYHRDYWLPIQGDELPPPLALVVFDAAVNLGPNEAIHLMQTALNVAIDGDIGPQTRAAARMARADQLVEFTALRGLRYANDEDFPHYGHGWLRRTADALRVAVALPWHAENMEGKP